MKIEEFADNITDFYSMNSSDQIKYLVYYLLIVCKQDGVRPNEVKKLFENLHILPYSNISKYLNEKSSGKKQSRLFVKKKDSFYLLKETKEQVDLTYINSKPKLKVSAELKDLAIKITNPNQNAFFEETIKCYSVGAYRATIIMIWNLTVDHLFEYILAKKLTEFNIVLAANTDKRIKITCVSIKDDFNEMPENKFIEFCRSAKIISNDVRKILDTNLGIRNSAAHPSNITFTENKTISIVEDLINNVLLKY
jgi:hypothetical protein